MECPRCNTSLEEEAVFCGHCGALLKPRLGSEFATVGDLPPDSIATVVTGPNSPPPATSHPQSHNQNDMQSTVYVDRDPFSSAPNIQQKQHAQPNNAEYQQPRTPPVQPPLQSGRGKLKLFIFLLLAFIIAGGAIASAIFYMSQKPAPSSSVTATGQVSFFDSQASIAGNTDALKITTSGLSNPPSGYQYNAWLLDTANEQILPLGALSKSGKDFVLTYNQPEKNLIGQGNEIEITQEQQGQPSEPSGKPLLSATFPPEAFVHIRHLLTKYPYTPNQIGLLVGLLNETQKLNAQAAILQNSLSANEGQVRQCLAQSIIDIIEGKNGADYSALPGGCSAQNIMRLLPQ